MFLLFEKPKPDLRFREPGLATCSTLQCLPPDRAYALFCADESWRLIPLQLKSSTFEQQALFERDSQPRFIFGVRGKQRIATPLILPRDSAWVPAGR